MSSQNFTKLVPKHRLQIPWSYLAPDDSAYHEQGCDPREQSIFISS